MRGRVWTRNYFFKIFITFQDFYEGLPLGKFNFLTLNPISKSENCNSIFILIVAGATISVGWGGLSWVGFRERSIQKKYLKKNQKTWTMYHSLLVVSDPRFLLKYIQFIQVNITVCFVLNFLLQLYSNIKGKFEFKEQRLFGRLKHIFEFIVSSLLMPSSLRHAIF